MIDLKSAYENWQNLGCLVHGIKDLNTFVELVYNNPDFDITNDLRYSDNLIDVNYRNICATIKQVDEDTLSLLPDIEVWEDEELNVISLNIYAYGQYTAKFINDINVKISNGVHPYDEQEYYYAIDSVIFRNGKVVEKIEYNEEEEILTEQGKIIVRLIELNSSLEPKIVNN